MHRLLRTNIVRCINTVHPLTARHKLMPPNLLFFICNLFWHGLCFIRCSRQRSTADAQQTIR